eukprot:TRINITY_DN8317_c0_g1_i2.p1 TRINITY_DN8317_c0_g1~~TRINITY_DN8317_c0_g1_i2.p1  ORF type:complete len:578 (+),score=60.16 TRINITY_DN8317_c0_g1_i2:47-1735(+)
MSNTLLPSPRIPFLKQDATSYDEVYNTFSWNIPEYYNIGFDVCDKHLPGRANQDAIIFEDENGEVSRYSYGYLSDTSNRLAHSLAEEININRGDRVGILLGQLPETALSHIALYKMGAIAIPLFTLFGTDALEYRLKDSGAKAIITDNSNLSKMLEILPRLPELRFIILIGPGRDNEGHDGVVMFDDLVRRGSSAFTPVNTLAEDPALIIYTSGTTGNPKGCLHAHRVLLGHMPGIELPHDLFPRPEHDRLVFYTPADWAWIGGLIDVLLPSLHHGVTVLAHRPRKFDPERLVDMMVRHQVRHVFMPPTALKMMRQCPHLPSTTVLYTMASGGESLGDQLLDWGKETFGIAINEIYGQTEVNLVVGCCAKIMPTRRGAMGRAIPGHNVEIVSPTGDIMGPGQVGNIAVRAPDPVMFLRYWNNEQATKNKFCGDWLLTGDLGKKDDDGYFWYVGREDDIINTSGYRIGPAEIENCLIKHYAIAMAAVVGVPDDLRGQVVKAYVVLREGNTPSESLKVDIQEFVKHVLAAHEYPRIIEFVAALPMTTTGKIMRRTLRDMHTNQR